MTDLKPCPFCGGREDYEPFEDDDGFIICSFCAARAPHTERWNTRPALELPEGFSLDSDGDLVDGAGDLLAYGTGGGWVSIKDNEGDIAELSSGQVRALAIWLQRRAAKPPETGTQTSEESK